MGGGGPIALLLCWRGGGGSTEEMHAFTEGLSGGSAATCQLNPLDFCVCLSVFGGVSRGIEREERMGRCDC